MNEKYRLLPKVVGLLWIMILIFTGCAQRRSHTPTGDQAAKTEEVIIRKGKRPAWIDGPSMHYPSQTYLRGVGYGPDRQTAEDQARSELAKIFYSQIESRNSTYQSYLQTDTGKHSNHGTRQPSHFFQGQRSHTLAYTSSRNLNGFSYYRLSIDDL